MPRRSKAPPFVVTCTPRELEAHLAVCAASDFRIARDRAAGSVTVTDRATVIVHAVRAGGAWLVRLDRRYYRHPFGPLGNGDAPPGVP
jgi:hypothetical protein